MIRYLLGFKLLYIIISNIFLFLSLSLSAASFDNNTEKTAVFALVAADAYINSVSFNKWQSLDKTKGYIHIFADVSARYKLDMLNAHKHFVKADALVETMSEILAEILESSPVTRLIIFINTHGTPRGNWCYENMASCSLNESRIIELLARKKYPKLEHVLIVPLVCFNNIAMNKFASKINDLSWSFEISWLMQKNIDECLGHSAAHCLLDNMIVPFDSLTDSDFDNFISVETIEDFIIFNNNLIGEELGSFLHYEIQHLYKRKADLKLSDFGFKLELETDIYYNPLAPVAIAPTALIKDALSGIIAPRFYQNISSLKFYFDEDETIDKQLFVLVNNNIYQPIINQAFEGQKYMRLTAIMSPDKGINL
jgi:hypothetical protein